MEKKNSQNISNSKAKVVSSTSNLYNNIQPRVVLQRLSKDYTFGVTSGSDNRPSTSGYLSPNNKSSEVDSSVSDDTSDSIINSGDNHLVTPSTSTTSGSHFRRKKVIEFRVAPLREADLSEIERSRNRHNEDSSSDCSFHSSTKEVIVVEDNKTETEEGEDSEESEESGEGEEVGCQEFTDAGAIKFEKPTSSEGIGSEENCIRERGETEAKIQKAISFLKLLIDTYGRRVKKKIKTDQPSTSRPSENPIAARCPVTSSVVIRPQHNNLKNCVVRVWLSIRGQKKKKKFHVRLSQLILLLNNKNHPLHKFRNTFNLRTLRFLSDNELRVMARVLSDFACAKRVKF